MSNSALIRVRSAIAEMVEGFAGETNEAAFAEFRNRHPALMAEAAEEMQRLAFIKLKHDVFGRSRKASAGLDHGDLFQGLSHPLVIQVPVFRKRKMVRRKPVLFEDATIAEAEAWVAYQSAPRVRRDAKYKKIEGLLTIIRTHVKDRKMSIRDAQKMIDGSAPHAAEERHG